MSNPFSESSAYPDMLVPVVGLIQIIDRERWDTHSIAGNDQMVWFTIDSQPRLTLGTILNPTFALNDRAAQIVHLVTDTNVVLTGPVVLRGLDWESINHILEYI